jgi:hypothetical protein
MNDSPEWHQFWHRRVKCSSRQERESARNVLAVSVDPDQPPQETDWDVLKAD